MHTIIRSASAGGALVLALAACSAPVDSPPPEQSAATESSTPETTEDEAPLTLLPLAEREPLCPPARQSAMGGAEAIMDDTYDLGPAPPTQLPRDIDWGADPFGSPNWQFNLHAMRYLWSLDQATAHTGEPAYRERAFEIARDWVNDNPREDPPSNFSWNDHATAWRTMVLTCLYERDPRDWLAAALRLHLETLSDPEFYVEHGNHALNQSIGLLQAACALQEPEAGELALARIDDLIRESIDEQGVTNEQAVEYQQYNYGRYDAARRTIDDCGVTPSAGFERLGLMPRFIAHATLPDGTLTPLGDTDRRPAVGVPGTPTEFAATLGEQGTAPDERSAVFDGGFAFARSGWGEDRPFDQETHVSVRFGGPRRLHGHHDAGSITLFSHGRQLVVDPGKYEYISDDMRTYVMSPRAHNLVTSPACDHPDLLDQHQMTLDDHHTVDGLVQLTVRGLVPGCHDARWTRTVLFSEHGRYLVVIDDIRGPAVRTYTQRWHLEAGAETDVLDAEVEAVVGPVRLHLMSASGAAVGGIVEGSEDPLDGWVSKTYGEVVPAPVVTFEESATTARFVTVLAPTETGQDPTVSVGVEGGVTTIDFGLGGRPEVVRVSEDGPELLDRGVPAASGN